MDDSKQQISNEIEKILEDGDDDDFEVGESRFGRIGREKYNKSAPARMLSLNENTLFAFHSKFASYFQDIRCDSNYDEFYQSHPHPQELPTPITGQFWSNNQKIIRTESSRFVPKRGLRSPGAGGKNKYVYNKYDKEKMIKEKMSKYSSITDFRRRTNSLARDQYGCRFLQNKLDENDPTTKKQIFLGVYKNVVKLMSDPFGNYLCQKLLDKCTEDEKTSLLEACSESLVEISTNIHGTRAVQKFIEMISTKRQKEILRDSLKDHIVTLIKDLYGNHVVQKILREMKNEDKQFVYDSIVQNCTEVAKHKHGCCVIQRCFDYSNEKQKLQLIKEISKHSLTFIRDPFGNYVIQYVLNLNVEGWNDVIIRKFLGHIFGLSKNKFSSNVIEKCLKIAEEETKNLLVDEILKMKRLSELLRDPFGNYVVQTAISMSTPEQLEQFKSIIKPMLSLIKNTKYVRNIELKLNRQQGGRRKY